MGGPGRLRVNTVPDLNPSPPRGPEDSKHPVARNFDGQKNGGASRGKQAVETTYGSESADPRAELLATAIEARSRRGASAFRLFCSFG